MKKNPDNVDVIITDHSMPEMTGLELAGKCKQEWPEKPLILATGYRQQMLKDDPNLVHMDYMLKKPYDIDILNETLTKVLTGEIAEKNIDES